MFEQDVVGLADRLVCGSYGAESASICRFAWRGVRWFCSRRTGRRGVSLPSFFQLVAE